MRRSRVGDRVYLTFNGTINKTLYITNIQHNNVYLQSSANSTAQKSEEIIVYKCARWEYKCKSLYQSVLSKPVVDINFEYLPPLVLELYQIVKLLPRLVFEKVLNHLIDSELYLLCEVMNLSAFKDDDFWANRLNIRYGPSIVKLKPTAMSYKEFYQSEHMCQLGLFYEENYRKLATDFYRSRGKKPGYLSELIKKCNNAHLALVIMTFDNNKIAVMYSALKYHPIPTNIPESEYYRHAKQPIYPDSFGVYLYLINNGDRELLKWLLLETPTSHWDVDIIKILSGSGFLDEIIIYCTKNIDIDTPSSINAIYIIMIYATLCGHVDVIDWIYHKYKIIPNNYDMVLGFVKTYCQDIDVITWATRNNLAISQQLSDDFVKRIRSIGVLARMHVKYPVRPLKLDWVYSGSDSD